MGERQGYLGPDVKVGVSGTRNGCNPAQYLQLELQLEDMFGLYDTVMHGDCSGVDYEAHIIAYRIGYQIEIFPPLDPKHRMFLPSDRTHAAAPYLDRDRAIVDEGDSMLIVPQYAEKDPRSKRSGTWYTYRYALAQGKPLTLIVGGRFDHEQPDDGDTVHLPARP
jgi:hypothetical protein